MEMLLIDLELPYNLFMPGLVIAVNFPVSQHISEATDDFPMPSHVVSFKIDVVKYTFICYNLLLFLFHVLVRAMVLF